MDVMDVIVCVPVMSESRTADGGAPTNAGSSTTVRGAPATGARASLSGRDSRFVLSFRDVAGLDEYLYVFLTLLPSRQRFPRERI